MAQSNDNSDLDPLVDEFLESWLPSITERAELMARVHQRVHELSEVFALFRQTWPQIAIVNLENVVVEVGESLEYERGYVDTSLSQTNAVLLTAYERLGKEPPDHVGIVPDEKVFVDFRQRLQAMEGPGLLKQVDTYFATVTENFRNLLKNLYANDNDIGKLVRTFESEATELYAQGRPQRMLPLEPNSRTPSYDDLRPWPPPLRPKAA